MCIHAHYIIGSDGEIIQCVLETEVAYHDNSANGYSIGIENCHLDWDGKFNSKTYPSLVELCAYLCRRYSLDPATRLYDITMLLKRIVLIITLEILKRG